MCAHLSNFVITKKKFYYIVKEKKMMFKTLYTGLATTSP